MSDFDRKNGRTCTVYGRGDMGRTCLFRGNDGVIAFLADFHIHDLFRTGKQRPLNLGIACRQPGKASEIQINAGLAAGVFQRQCRLISGQDNGHIPECTLAVAFDREIVIIDSAAEIHVRIVLHEFVCYIFIIDPFPLVEHIALSRIDDRLLGYIPLQHDRQRHIDVIRAPVTDRFNNRIMLTLLKEDGVFQADSVKSRILIFDCAAGGKVPLVRSGIIIIQDIDSIFDLIIHLSGNTGDALKHHRFADREYVGHSGQTRLRGYPYIRRGQIVILIHDFRLSFYPENECFRSRE